MNSQEACEVLDQLNHFPKITLARVMIMQTIDKYVPQSRIAGLVEDICAKYDTWPGPATFAAECKAAGEEETGSVKTWKPDYSAQVAGELCPRCDSWGHVQRNGNYERCSCTAGYELDSEFLQLLNSRTVEGRGRREVVPITQADIDAIVRGKKGR